MQGHDKFILCAAEMLYALNTYYNEHVFKHPIEIKSVKSASNLDNTFELEITGADTPTGFYIKADSSVTPRIFPGLTEGRIVHYVQPNGRHTPAIVTNDKGYGIVDLQVFLNRQNENVMWIPEVSFNDQVSPETWHWIEPA